MIIEENLFEINLFRNKLTITSTMRRYQSTKKREKGKNHQDRK